MLDSYVEEAANNPGTATTINLAGAATGRRDFIATFGSGAPVFYALDNGSLAEWGFGTVIAGSPNTLARTTVLGNTAGTTARLNFTGTTRVFCTLPAAAVLFRNPATLDLQVGRIPIGQLGGLRNLLINANPLINQRAYVSGTATVGANQYTLDRWRVVTTGQSITWSDSANTRTVTAPAGGVEQVVEGASILGGTYTLSWTGTATATLNGTPVGNGGSVTLTGGADATLRFSGGTFGLPQLERGGAGGVGAPTAFEARPRQIELALCQRYYQVALFTVSAVATAGAQDIYGALNWKVTLRTSPTVVKTAGTFTNCTDPGAPGVGADTYSAFIRSTAAGAVFGSYTIQASAEL